MAKDTSLKGIFPRGEFEVVSKGSDGSVLYGYEGVLLRFDKEVGEVLVEDRSLPYFAVYDIAREIVDMISSRVYYDVHLPFWFLGWKKPKEARALAAKIARDLLPYWREVVSPIADRVHRRAFSVMGRTSPYSLSQVIKNGGLLGEFMQYRAAVVAATYYGEPMDKAFPAKYDVARESLLSLPGGVTRKDIIVNAIQYSTSRPIRHRLQWILLGVAKSYVPEDVAATTGDIDIGFLESAAREGLFLEHGTKLSLRSQSAAISAISLLLFYGTNGGYTHGAGNVYTGYRKYIWGVLSDGLEHLGEERYYWGKVKVTQLMY